MRGRAEIRGSRRSRSAFAPSTASSTLMSNSPLFHPSLRAIQEQYGYLPREELKALAVRLRVPMHRLHEVITFFPHFRLEQPPDVWVEVRVCRDQACHLRGA